MSDLWIIYALSFGAALSGAHAIYWIFFNSRQRKSVLNRRLALTEKLRTNDDSPHNLRRERALHTYESQWATEINDYLVQTGIEIDYKVFFIYGLLISALLFLFFGLFTSFNAVALLFSVVMSFAIMLLYVWRARKLRIALFSDQLPDALDIVVRGLKVGHPLPTSLMLVAKEMPDPIGTEFSITFDEIAFGLDINTAVDHLCRRVGQKDLVFFQTAINIQNKTGGNLAEVFSRLSRLIRQRTRVRLKIRSLTSEGRLSAIVLTLMPFIIFGVLYVIAPSYYAEASQHPAAIPTLIISISLLVFANIVIHRMINFKL